MSIAALRAKELKSCNAACLLLKDMSENAFEVHLLERYGAKDFETWELSM